MTVVAEQKEATEFRSIFNTNTCTRRGMCPVTKIRYQRETLESHSLYYEVHGSGSQKIIFIMGQLSSCFAWASQVDYFGKLDQYSTLVFDNRGVGMSGAPWGPYSTGGMAEDLLCLLNYLGWTEDRNLHVVGTSLGGMIAQELARRIPDRIASLGLIVTRAGGGIWANIPTPSGCLRFARLFVTSATNLRLPIALEMLFPVEWLNAVAEDDSHGRTNRMVQSEHLRHRMAITKPQTIVGAVGQMVAGVTHSMAPNVLAEISASVPKVLILNGTDDIVIPHAEGENLKHHMPEAEYQCWEKTGHGIIRQYKNRFNALLEDVFEQGMEASSKHASSN